MSKNNLGKAAVYRLYDRNGALLYVGLGSDPKTRWRAHARDKEWWPDVAHKEVEWHNTFAEAVEAEHAAIHAENPVYNKASWKWSKSESPQLHPQVRAVPASQARGGIRDILDDAESGVCTQVVRYQTPIAVFVPHDWYEKAVEALKSTK